jgi:hypothetical protein
VVRVPFKLVITRMEPKSAWMQLISDASFGDTTIDSTSLGVLSSSATYANERKH